MNSSGDSNVEVLADAASVPVDDRDRNVLGGWIFLGLLMALFLAIALWAYRSPRSGNSTVVLGDPTPTTEAPAPASTPAVIEVVVERKLAVVSGSVPDEGARTQLIRIAEARFGNGNVTDDLVVESGIDLASGTINFSGIADQGDSSAQEFSQIAAADLGLSEGAFDLEFVAPQFDPADIEVAVGTVPVVLTGRVPTEPDRDRLLQSAEAVYGEGNVDVTGVVVEPSDLTGAQFTLTGLTEPGDTRSADLVGILETDFRTVTVVNESEIDLSDEALTALEDRLAETLAERPILFDLGTSTISDEGQDNLLVIADAIQAVPDNDVLIVGHTDDTGGDALNQVLSERRAEAVKAALVGLGVDESRLTTEGRGSTDPAVPNTSADNRARNRRIQFSFER